MHEPRRWLARCRLLTLLIEHFEERGFFGAIEAQVRASPRGTTTPRTLNPLIPLHEKRVRRLFFLLLLFSFFLGAAGEVPQVETPKVAAGGNVQIASFGGTSSDPCKSCRQGNKQSLLTEGKLQWFRRFPNSRSSATGSFLVAWIHIKWLGVPRATTVLHAGSSHAWRDSIPIAWVSWAQPQKPGV